MSLATVQFSHSLKTCSWLNKAFLKLGACQLFVFYQSSSTSQVPLIAKENKAPEMLENADSLDKAQDILLSAFRL